MSLMKEIKNIPSTEKDLRSFAHVVGGVFAVLGALWTWKQHAHGPWFLAGGLILVAAGFMAPRALKPLQRAWMTLALMMGFVMTRVLLTILYLFVVTPIGLLSRLAGKKFLNMGFRDTSAETYWGARVKSAKTVEDYQRQF